jgi:hypothetical protein
MLEVKIFLVDLSMVGQPVFELASGLHDVHAGNDSDRARGKSNAWLQSKGDKEKSRGGLFYFSAFSDSSWGDDLRHKKRPAQGAESSVYALRRSLVRPEEAQAYFL